MNPHRLFRVAAWLGSLMILCMAAAQQPEQSTAYNQMVGKIQALCIGIEKYDNPAIGSPAGVLNDVTQMGQLLAQHYGYNVEMLQHPGTTTRTHIEARIQYYCDSLADNDALIIFIAGHGVRVEETLTTQSGQMARTRMRGFIVPSDCRLDLNSTDLAAWCQQGVDMLWLERKLNGAKARHKVVMCDACFSGLIGMRGKVEHAGLLEMLGQRSCVAITAGADKEVAYATQNNGIFTGELLEVLKGKEPLSLMQLYAQVEERVRSRSNGNMRPQFRSLTVGNGEFVFIPKGVQLNASIGAILADKRGALMDQRFLAIARYYEAAAMYAYGQTSNPQRYREVWTPKVDEYRKAASFGDPVGMAAMCFAAAKGLGMNKDEKLAFEYGQAAYQSGLPCGMSALAYCYDHGFGIAKNEGAAGTLYEAAAAQGDGVALNWLARRTFVKQTDAAEAQEAVKRLQQALDGGYPAAAPLMATVLLGKVPGIKPDATRVKQLLEQAAQKDVREAHFMLFQYYFFGGPLLHIETNRELARKHLLLAANQGYPRAQIFLAGDLSRTKQPATQDLFPVNLTEARQWLELAAEPGEAEAHFELAQMYAMGEGGPVDLAKAKQHVEAAVAAGHANAMLLMATWRYQGEVYELDKAAARPYLKMAAQGGVPEAQYFLAQLIISEAEEQEPGVDFPESFWPAIELLVKAAEQGDAKSKEWLDRHFKSTYGHLMLVDKSKPMDQFTRSMLYNSSMERLTGALEEHAPETKMRLDLMINEKLKYPEVLAKARQGDAIAQFLIGERLLKQDGYFDNSALRKFGANSADGMHWLIQAATQGQAAAQELVNAFRNQLTFDRNTAENGQSIWPTQPGPMAVYAALEKAHPESIELARTAQTSTFMK